MFEGSKTDRSVGLKCYPPGPPSSTRISRARCAGVASANAASYLKSDASPGVLVKGRKTISLGTRRVSFEGWNSPWSGRPSQNSKYAPARVGCAPPSVPVAGSKPSSIPCRLSQAASVSAGSAPTMSRIICQAARLNAPSGAGPIASETEHCGQKQIRCAEDFWRGLTPTVCAKRNTATDFCPASSSRLQRRQYKLSKSPVSESRVVFTLLSPRRCRWHKYVEGFPQARTASYPVVKGNS